MKIEIFSQNRFIGILEKEQIFNENIKILATGSIIDFNKEKYVVKDIVVKENGTVRLLT